jgi:hypothetical protein
MHPSVAARGFAPTAMIACEFILIGNRAFRSRKQLCPFSPLEGVAMTREQPCRLAWIVGAGMVGGAVLLIARGLAGDKAPPKGILSTDVSKGGIELPTEKLLASTTVPSPSLSAPNFINPKVKPGEVRWHKTFAAACAAAKKSGKPVLLFQMTGKLDERFC